MYQYIEHNIWQHDPYLDFLSAPFDHPTGHQDEVEADPFTEAKKIRDVSVLETCIGNKTIFMHVLDTVVNIEY